MNSPVQGEGGAKCEEEQEQPGRLACAARASSPAQSAGAAANLEPAQKEPFECEVYADYGKNYLTPIDVVVKNSDDNIACIKARFALSIKVEEAFTLRPQEAAGGANETIRSVLGYLPLEQVLSVEDSCPRRQESKDKKAAEANGPAAKTNGAPPGEPEKRGPDREQDQNAAAADHYHEHDHEHEHKHKHDHGDTELDKLEMIVTFGCGKLSFTFRRDKGRIFVSAIRGIVKLGEFPRSSRQRPRP